MEKMSYNENDDEVDTLTASVETVNGQSTDAIEVDLRTQDEDDSGEKGKYMWDCSDQLRVATFMKGTGPEREEIEIFVRTLGQGQLKKIRISPHAFVQDLKLKLDEKASLHPNEYYLEFGGKPLLDGKTLSSYCIHNHSEIHMMGRMRGGRGGGRSLSQKLDYSGTIYN